MDELIAFRLLTKELGDVVIGEGRRQEPSEEQRRLRRMCELSLQLYRRGTIQKKEFTWANVVARRFFLLPPHKPEPDNYVVDYLAA